MQGRRDPSSRPHSESTGQSTVSAERESGSEPAPKHELRPGQTTLLEDIVSVAPTESDNWLDAEQTSRYNAKNTGGESPVFSFAKRAREIGASRAQLSWSTRPVALQAQPVALQIHPAALQAQPAASQTHPAVLQAHPAALQAHPAVLQAHPAALQAHPLALQAPPAASQTHPAVLQTHPAALQAHPVALQAQPLTMQAQAPSAVQVQSTVATFVGVAPQPRASNPPPLPLPAALQPEAQPLQPARPGLTPPSGFLPEPNSARSVPNAIPVRPSAPPPPPLPLPRASHVTPTPVALHNRPTGGLGQAAAAATASPFAPPAAHMPGMSPAPQSQPGVPAAYGVDPSVLHQLQRQLILALERVRASEARSAEAERRAQWAEQLASEAKRQSGAIAPLRPSGVASSVTRGVVSAAAVSLVCFSIGGYLSLLIPVRQRVLTQEAALRGLTEVRNELERQNHGLAEKLHELDPQRFDAPREASAEARPEPGTTVLAERTAKR